MRIAFYAPLKGPDHATASGDRAMARGLIAALRLGGHEVDLASRFRSFDRGDPARQQRLRRVGLRLADRFVQRAEAGANRPDLWFTYHLYHKAADWIGPRVSERLGIPYVLAEASYAPKQANGRWRVGHAAVADAIRRADRVFQINPADAEYVLPLLQSPKRLVPVPPFLQARTFQRPDRASARSALAGKHEFAPEEPWLLTVAMMRDDQKLLSYRCLAEALESLTDIPWRLLVVGSGPAEASVRDAFAKIGSRLTWLGALAGDALVRAYRAADVLVWPAIKEAYGMALLEAQAAGLPVVAGNSGGVSSVVADGITGILTSEGNTAAFSAAVRSVLSDPERLRRMGNDAQIRAEAGHDISVAAAILDRELRAAVAERTG